MTRERWEQILFAHVPDEVVQDMLNEYVLELSAENRLLRAEKIKLRELVRELYEDQCDEYDQWRYRDRMCELGIEVE